MKDPSFAGGRNLITYAVNLLTESKACRSHITGVRILGTILLSARSVAPEWPVPRLISETRAFYHRAAGHEVLINHLLLTESAVIQKLLETFGPRSPYNREISEKAASIVANVAGSIRLEQYPRSREMIECISSLLDTFEEYSWRPEGYHDERRRVDLPKEYQRGWLLEDFERRLCFISQLPKIVRSPIFERPNRLQACSNKFPFSLMKKKYWYKFWYKFVRGDIVQKALMRGVIDASNNSIQQGYKFNPLVVQGLCILQKLAIDKDNCTVICNTQGLLSKSMAPLISDHHGASNHKEWSKMAEESLELMKRLMATPGETGTKLRSGNLIDSQVIIRNLESILECLECEVLPKKQAAEVLLDLLPVHTHTPSTVSGVSESNSEIFLWMLLHIFLLPDYHFGRMCGSTHLAKKSSDIATLAGEKLEARYETVPGAIFSLAKTDADAENTTETEYMEHASSGIWFSITGMVNVSTH
jgi:hypothetical protein